MAHTARAAHTRGITPGRLPPRSDSVGRESKPEFGCKVVASVCNNSRTRAHSERRSSGRHVDWHCSYEPGEMVDYYSASARQWILAKVLGKSKHVEQNYDLDCKISVAPERIRKRAQGPSHGARDRCQSAPPASMRLLNKFLYVAPSLNPSHCLLQDSTFSDACKPSCFTKDARKGDEQHRHKLKQSSVVPPCPSPHAEVDNSSWPYKPMQLLRTRYDGKQHLYEICPASARALQKIGPRSITVASIFGATHSGKSFLLNWLMANLHEKAPQFQVGQSTKTCTDGLWLCSLSNSSSIASESPIYMFIDCEGSGGTHSNQERDAQLAMLCILLSSLVLVNTKGVLSEKLVSTLSLACRCTQRAKMHMPSVSQTDLFVIIRDFALELVSDNGCPISPTGYLEQMLHAVPLAGHESERGKGALENRRTIMDTFPQRRCSTLVRPVVDEVQLASLESLPRCRLRPEFIENADAFHKEFMETIHSNPKKIHGQRLDCISFLALLQQLVDFLNDESRSENAREEPLGATKQTICSKGPCSDRTHCTGSFNYALLPAVGGVVSL